MKLLSFILIIYLAVACLPEPLEIDVPQAESKLVISSQVVPNNNIVIAVSRSFSALEGKGNKQSDADGLDKYLIEHALVVLSYAHISDTLSTSPATPGVYFSKLKPEEPNELFSLFVHDSISGQEVTSQSTMLDKVSMQSVVLTAKPTESVLDTVYNLSVRFEDPAGENWYALNIINPKKLGKTNDIFAVSGSEVSYTLLISDKIYNSKQINFEAEIMGFQIPDTAVVMLSNISESYFRYLDARKRGGSILASITGEPVNHPSNVQNGYGYFNTYNPSIQQVIVSK
ncbi:DUF4249 family protein [bacterium]|nr:DUF4249 family protein [bacterium]